MVAGRALDLTPGKLHAALKMLLAVGAFEFEFIGWHKGYLFQMIVL
jgi:hypothetical protein